MKQHWLAALAIGLSAAASLVVMPTPVEAQDVKKPNILVIWGDDIGTWNISHNNRGMMGYRTPNIDRIARDGVGFTDYYGQQSCTAGRAAFIGGIGAGPQRHDQSRSAGRERGLAENRRDDGHRAEVHKAMPLASSARTTKAISTSTFRRCTASTSSSATCTI